MAESRELRGTTITLRGDLAEGNRSKRAGTRVRGSSATSTCLETCTVDDSRFTYLRNTRTRRKIGLRLAPACNYVQQRAN